MAPRTYAISVLPSAIRALTRLPAEARERVTRAIDTLATEPRPIGCRKLAGSRGQYRIRVGDYRIIYEVRDAELVLIVVTVGHRRDVYR